jgi:nucleoside-diphosphate-sugar epimerase
LARLLVLGAGYLGAALAERALAAGEEVILADNWHATEPAQLEPLKAAGAAVQEADLRSPQDLERLLAHRPSCVYLLAAQTSRLASERDPDYTEQTNLTGVRRAAEAIAAAGTPSVVYASSLHVYGAPVGEVRADHPYGEQGDLAHLSKVYGELCLRMYAARSGLDLSILRLGIVYGPSPVEHSDPEHQTVIDKFRRLAATRRELPLDEGGLATIGAVHIDDVVRIMLAEPSRPGTSIANVVAETTTVGDVAALLSGRSASAKASCSYSSGFEYRHRLADYLAAPLGSDAAA